VAAGAQHDCCALFSEFAAQQDILEVIEAGKAAEAVDRGDAPSRDLRDRVRDYKHNQCNERGAPDTHNPIVLCGTIEPCESPEQAAAAS
jgi:hypothetical protein